MKTVISDNAENKLHPVVFSEPETVEYLLSVLHKHGYIYGKDYIKQQPTRIAVSSFILSDNFMSRMIRLSDGFVVPIS